MNVNRKNMIYVDDVPSSRFKGIFFRKLPLWTTATENIDSVKVQGRADDLSISTGHYNDISITLTAVALTGDFEELDNLTRWISEGKTIRLSNQNDRYAYIKSIQKIEKKRIGSGAAEISISLKCSPFKYEAVGGFTSFTSSPGYFESRGNIYSEPLIQLNGIGGNCTIKLNDKQFEISGFTGNCTIDVEKKTVYKENSDGTKTSILEFTSGDLWELVVLPPALFDAVKTNKIEFSGVSQVRILKNVRWY